MSIIYKDLEISAPPPKKKKQLQELNIVALSRKSRLQEISVKELILSNLVKIFYSLKPKVYITSVFFKTTDTGLSITELIFKAMSMGHLSVGVDMEGPKDRMPMEQEETEKLLGKTKEKRQRAQRSSLTQKAKEERTLGRRKPLIIRERGERQ